MKSIIINKKEEGLKLDKYLFNLLKNAPTGLIYKQLRKKNITLNDKKDDGKTVLRQGDEIKLFFSDDTYNKFINNTSKNGFIEHIKTLKKQVPKDLLQNIKDNIIYEDEDCIFVNKKVGVLSQKAENTDISINELIIEYLYDKGELSEDDLNTFKPSVTNRLDRNTSGIITAGKSIKGLQTLSKHFKERSMEKYYLTVCVGEINEEMLLKGSHIKDEEHNQAFINIEKNDDGGNEIYTKVYPIKVSKDKKYSLIKVELITGKTHQIRAHLSAINHPIIGDYKYGDKQVNKYFRETYGLSNHLLHAYSMKFMDSELKNLNNKTYISEVPDKFKVIMKDIFKISMEDI